MTVLDLITYLYMQEKKQALRADERYTSLPTSLLKAWIVWRSRRSYWQGGKKGTDWLREKLLQKDTCTMLHKHKIFWSHWGVKCLKVVRTIEISEKYNFHLWWNNVKKTSSLDFLGQSLRFEAARSTTFLCEPLMSKNIPVHIHVQLSVARVCHVKKP